MDDLRYKKQRPVRRSFPFVSWIAVTLFLGAWTSSCGRVVKDPSPTQSAAGGSSSVGGQDQMGGAGGTVDEQMGGAGGTPVDECSDGTFEGSPGECVPWRTCDSGEFVDDEGTSVSDRDCSPCALGTFSHSENAEACAPWTPCEPFQVVVTEGQDSSDQICALLYPARVSLADGRTELVRESSDPLVSNEGRYIFFNYTFSDLAEDDTNIYWDVYRVDFTSGETMRVSLGDHGQQADGESVLEAISADGNFVLFHSPAGNLVSGDENGEYDVFLRNIAQETTTLVSVTPEGTSATGRSTRATVSPDGRYVLFSSVAADLVEGDNNGQRDMFLRDMVTQLTVLVSVGTDGTAGNGAAASGAMSSDARYIAFSSTSNNLVENDTNGHEDIFLRDLFLDTTTRISVSSEGVQADSGSSTPYISADGSKVVFISVATNLVVSVENDTYDVFLHDVQSGETTLVSVSTSGTAADGWSVVDGFSADGTRVLVRSAATTLLEGNSDDYLNLFVRDVAAGTTSWVSHAYDGEIPNGYTDRGAISADGAFVVYGSQADNLVPFDTNGQDDVFLVPVP